MHKRNAKAEAKAHRLVPLVDIKQGAVIRVGLLTSEWSASLDQGKVTAVVALDIEGAFNRVQYAAIVSNPEQQV